MRLSRFLLLCTGAFVIAGCEDDSGATITDIPPLAYTRFVNAVPDHGATDWRFIDILMDSPPAFALAYRGFTPYQGTAVGTHTLRIFPTSTNIDVTSVPVIEEEITLQEGRYYTIIHAGYTAGTPADDIIVIEDNITTPAAGRFGIRTLNLSTTTIDAYAVPTTSSPLPGSPLFDAVDFSEATTYAELDTGAVAMRATADGTVTPVLASATAPAGVAGDPAVNLTTIGGSRQSGSAILAIFTPRSVAGTGAPQGSAFQSPAWVYIIDRHPR